MWIPLRASNCSPARRRRRCRCLEISGWAEFYSSALRRTTTNLSAGQIHKIGLKEVARIHEEMTKIKDKIGFKGDLQAFFKFMRDDRQFYLPDTDEGRAKYLAQAVAIIDDMKKRLDELFATKPKADIVVKAVEKFREQSAGKAFYRSPLRMAHGRACFT